MGRHHAIWLVALLVLALPAAPVAAASTWYVGPGGIDDTNPGRGASAANPWGTIDFAVQHVTDDTPTLLVPDGTYTDPAVSLSRVFATYLTIHAQNPYRAILTNTGGQPVLRSFGGANYAIEGFIIGPTQSILAVQIGDQSNNFTFRNNIFRDSFNNDLLKVNDRATNVLIEGNLFYNRGGSDEDLDINAVLNVTVQDNIFFSDYAGSGRTPPGCLRQPSLGVGIDDHGMDVRLAAHGARVAQAREPRQRVRARVGVLGLILSPKR